MKYTFQQFIDSLPPKLQDKVVSGKGHLCCIAHCRKQRNRGRLCYKHRQEVYKLRHPLRYFFNNHRQNAKRRGKVWSLSFEQYALLWKLSGRLPHVKSDGMMWAIDRIDESRGYEWGNVRIVDFMTNSLRIAETNPEEVEMYGMDYYIRIWKNNYEKLKVVTGEVNQELIEYFAYAVE